MTVLIACEESQTICIAFRAYGVEAYSCDIQEPSGKHPEWHILGDALEAIKGGQVTTMDGRTHNVGRWDLMIAHPPCTYLSKVGNRWFNIEKYGDKAIKRYKEREKAAKFFMQFLTANADRIAIENPVGFMNTTFRSADQIIHPYMFAESVDDTENYVTKATCLWLVNLPNLKTNGLPRPDNRNLFGKWSNGKNRTWEETYSRSGKVRSKTFTGIANAIAEQWRY